MRVTFTELVPPQAGGNLAARRGRLETPHGKIETPVFMPVGTQGTVKGVLPRDLKEMGAEILLGNTYHLWLRPGAETLKAMGGLRPWMNWPGPLLTDSGGFQVFSLAKLRKISDEGVRFQSHLDGTALFLSPEESIRVQEAIGSTIMMALDVCPALPSPREEILAAVEQSTRWARRCLEARSPEAHALFGIVQGGLDREMRLRHLGELATLEARDRDGTRQSFDGLALGGFSVGENPAEMAECLYEIVPHMPRDRPRYLMGVGRPQDLLNGIAAGIDMFDCVMPTRNARNGTLFTSEGSLHIKNAAYIRDPRPIDETCRCHTCQNFSRSYLRHLQMSNEILGSVLATLHNLHFYLQLMKEARQAIEEGRFESYRRDRLERWRSPEAVVDLKA